VVSLGIFPWLPAEPCALGSTQPPKVSTRDFSCGKGGRCVGLRNYHPCSAKCQENPGSETTRNPLGHLGLLWDDLYLYPCVLSYVALCICFGTAY